MFRQLDCSVRHYTEQNEVIDFGELSAIVAGDADLSTLEVRLNPEAGSSPSLVQAQHDDARQPPV